MKIEKQITTITNTLKEKSGIFSLYRNNHPACCHIQPGIQDRTPKAHNKPAGLDFKFHGCTSLCPHFSLHQGNVVLSCQSGVTLKIEEPIQ